MGMMAVVRGLVAAGSAKGPTTAPTTATAGQGTPNRFDHLLDAINRLPRPLMALGTVALFADAMLDPVGFGDRMAALQAMPDPLWWLLGGIITFYFGARETHYLRQEAGAGAGAEGPDTKA